MEREFLDVLDYDLSVSEADLLDLHETFVVSLSPQPQPQLHPFFHTSALERAPRPQAVDLFRTRRVSDETSEEEEFLDHASVSSLSFYEDEVVPTTPLFQQLNSSDEETRVDSASSDPSSSQTPTSSLPSSEPSTTAISAFSYQPHMVSKPQDGAQKTAISRALWLAGHQLISSLPTAFSQVTVSS